MKGKRLLDLFIGVSALSVVVLASALVYQSERPRKAAALQVGAVLGLGEIFSGSKSNLGAAVVLSTTCPACEENVPFLAEVGRLCRQMGIPIIALFNEPLSVAEDWLARNEIPIDATYAASSRLRGAVRTPAIVILEEGVIADYWEGEVSSGDQALILGWLAEGKRTVSTAQQGSQVLPEIVPTQRAEAFIQDLASDLQLVDIRRRAEFHLGHHSLAVNIPIDELSLRAPVELDTERVAAVDCFEVPYIACSRAAKALTGLGFYRVAIIDRGFAPPPSCDVVQ